MKRLRSIVGLVGLLGLVGCGGGGDDAAPATTIDPRGAPLTSEQADVLAQLFHENHTDGGAAFTVDMPLAGGAPGATLSGEVDWVGHVASGTYTAEAGATPLGGVDYVWSPTIVLDGSVPGLEQAMAAEGREGVTWVSRPLDPTEVPLDGVLALLHTISSDRPGNPQVIAGEDAGYLGGSVEDGEPVDRYRFGDNTVYVVGADDGKLRRVEARFRSFPEPVVLTITDRGERRVASPQRDTVVDASTIPEIYARLTGRDAPTDPTPPPATGTSTPR